MRYCLSRRQQSGERATVIHFLCIEQSDQTQLFLILVTRAFGEEHFATKRDKTEVWLCVETGWCNSTHLVMCTSFSATLVSLVSRDKKLTNTTQSLMVMKMIDSFFKINLRIWEVAQQKRCQGSVARSRSDWHGCWKGNTRHTCPICNAFNT